MDKLLHRELTYAIIGAAMEVHKVLGPGFLELVYESAIAQELYLRNLPYHRQKHLDVSYKGQIVGKYIADFIIGDRIVVELKTTKGLTAIDEAQLINYLKATGNRVGLLINFGRPSLQYKRRVV